MLSFFKNLFKPTSANAAQAWQQAGNEAGSAYWLYAAPIHLILQRDSFSLAAPVPLVLEAHEIDAFTQALNSHFGADGMQFFWSGSQWFLSLQHHPNIKLVDPQKAINQNINAFMPTGTGAIVWASFQNECQMLLFQHPINIAREAKKLPAMNSIWCYDGGQIAQNEMPK